MNCSHFLSWCFCGKFLLQHMLPNVKMWVTDKDFGIITYKTVDLVVQHIYLFIYFHDFLFYARCAGCKSAAFKLWQDNEKHIAMLEARLKVAAVTFLYFYDARGTWSRRHFKLTRMSPVPFCQSQLHHVADTAEARGLWTRKPRDIIWFHFHRNSFPLADLILVSQYEPWPWISTGLQLVFNVHQGLM